MTHTKRRSNIRRSKSKGSKSKGSKSKGSKSKGSKSKSRSFVSKTRGRSLKGGNVVFIQEFYQKTVGVITINAHLKSKCANIPQKYLESLNTFVISGVSPKAEAWMVVEHCVNMFALAYSIYMHCVFEDNSAYAYIEPFDPNGRSEKVDELIPQLFETAKLNWEIIYGEYTSNKMDTLLSMLYSFTEAAKANMGITTDAQKTEAGEAAAQKKAASEADRLAMEKAIYGKLPAEFITGVVSIITMIKNDESSSSMGELLSTCSITREQTDRIWNMFDGGSTIYDTLDTFVREIFKRLCDVSERNLELNLNYYSERARRDKVLNYDDKRTKAVDGCKLLILKIRRIETEEATKTIELMASTGTINPKDFIRLLCEYANKINEIHGNFSGYYRDF